VKLRLLLTAVSVLTLVAGCSGDVTGTATADQAEPFDPCTIPDDAIAAAGLDPATKSSITDGGYITPGWDICSWDGSQENSWYSLSIFFSLVYTIEDVRTDTRYSEMTTLTVAGRESLRYKFGIVDLSETCDIAFQTEAGLIKISALKKGSQDLQGDMCDINTRHSEILSSTLPQS
jgi:hypothetical protein|uniref:DUF3558 domain-containing protein n=1 Tax=Winogradskyella pacifica TaxID=664642 RepID=UPI001C535E1C